MIKKIADLVNDKVLPGDLRRQGPLGQVRDADPDRAEARRRPAGRPEQALQAHAAADDVRLQRGRARRRRAADARRCATCSGTTSTSSARSSPGGRSSSCARPRPARTSSRGYLIALDNLDEVDRADPRRGRHRRGARRADGALRALRDPGPGDPRPAPPRADRRSSASGSRTSTPTCRSGSPSSARSSATRRGSTGVIREELLEIRQIYGKSDDRRTEIVAAEGELELEDLIAEEDMVIAITRSGYIKRLPVTTYREQRRGGIGVMGMELKDEDYIEHLFVASTHDYILFFTTRRQGLPAEGARAAARLAPVEGPRDREPAALPPGRAGAGRHPDARLRGGEVPRLRDEERRS